MSYLVSVLLILVNLTKHGIGESLVFSVPTNAMKIVVATNIAETSITLDDVVYVFDTGRMREMQYDPSKKVCMYEITQKQQSLSVYILLYDRDIIWIYTPHICLFAVIVLFLLRWGHWWRPGHLRLMQNSEPGGRAESAKVIAIDSTPKSHSWYTYMRHRLTYNFMFYICSFDL